MREVISIRQLVLMTAQPFDDLRFSTHHITRTQDCHAQEHAGTRKHKQAHAGTSKHMQAHASTRKHTQAYASIRRLRMTCILYHINIPSLRLSFLSLLAIYSHQPQERAPRNDEGSKSTNMFSARSTLGTYSTNLLIYLQ